MISRQRTLFWCEFCRWATLAVMFTATQSGCSDSKAGKRSVLIYLANKDNSPLESYGDLSPAEPAIQTVTLESLDKMNVGESTLDRTPWWMARDSDLNDNSIRKLFEQFPGFSRLRADQQLSSVVYSGVSQGRYRIAAYIPGYPAPIASRDVEIPGATEFELSTPRACPIKLRLETASSIVTSAILKTRWRARFASVDRNILEAWADGEPFEDGTSIVFWAIPDTAYHGHILPAIKSGQMIDSEQPLATAAFKVGHSIQALDAIPLAIKLLSP